MTVTGSWNVICPTCKQETELLFRPETQDYILLGHFTETHIKCATSNEVYPEAFAELVFFKEPR